MHDLRVSLRDKMRIVSELEQEMKRLRHELMIKEQKLDEKDRYLRLKDEIIFSKDRVIKDKDNQIKELENTLRNLNTNDLKNHNSNAKSQVPESNASTTTTVHSHITIPIKSNKLIINTTNDYRNGHVQNHSAVNNQIVPQTQHVSINLPNLLPNGINNTTNCKAKRVAISSESSQNLKKTKDIKENQIINPKSVE
jgi:predicted RNase H-like nuclease (RuvC/YqgF family)